MSKQDFAEFSRTGRMRGTTETFTSPTQAFSESYQGILVRFQLEKGTIGRLREIGVRAHGGKSARLLPDLPVVRKRWGKRHALFKPEGDQINIGLGTGRALDIFNNGTRGFGIMKVVR